MLSVYLLYVCCVLQQLAVEMHIAEQCLLFSSDHSCHCQAFYSQTANFFGHQSSTLEDYSLLHYELTDNWLHHELTDNWQVSTYYDDSQ